MSKTYKTNPWWVTAEWWRPVHDLRCENHTHIRCIGHRRSGSEVLECDLPAEPVVQHFRTIGWRGRSHDVRPRCRWEPDVPSYYSAAGARYWPRERYVKEQANQIERSIRAAWRTVRQELLQVSIGDLDDVELPDPRHRHFAMWDRW
jgi:hypothetical protein